MKPCLICGTACAPDAHTCPSCGCADFGLVAAPKPNDSAERSAVDSAPSAPTPNEPAKRRR